MREKMQKYSCIILSAAAGGGGEKSHMTNTVAAIPAEGAYYIWWCGTASVVYSRSVHARTSPC